MKLHIPKRSAEASDCEIAVIFRHNLDDTENKFSTQIVSREVNWTHNLRVPKTKYCQKIILSYERNNQMCREAVLAIFATIQ